MQSADQLILPRCARDTTVVTATKNFIIQETICLSAFVVLEGVDAHRNIMLIIVVDRR